jgi:hypothetical protein
MVMMVIARHCHSRESDTYHIQSLDHAWKSFSGVLSSVGGSVMAILVVAVIGHTEICVPPAVTCEQVTASVSRMLRRDRKCRKCHADLRRGM